MGQMENILSIDWWRRLNETPSSSLYSEGIGPDRKNDLLEKESNEEFDLWNNLLFWLEEISIEEECQSRFNSNH